MLKILALSALFTMLFPIFLLAESEYNVKKGDSLWKIAQKYDLGVTEVIEVNPQINNPNLIYPNEKVQIPTSDAIKHTEHIVIQLTNQLRARHGLSILRPSQRLSVAARFKAADMLEANYFDHKSPTEETIFNLLSEYDISYQRAAENIARGQQTPHQVVQAWLANPEQKANLFADFTHIGVGYIEDGKYWTQLFIKQ
ncbi:spore coat assembly protein SafA [Amphibacillus marinus]|uniref:Spore coat assembly protein SafA n=1 Tax=Amphibacillus marinus TaxID=872970 RepID=A0A1H8NK96_9BACI|nr:SafA/ExsA family spore coat assembly protein [Amphibacillus marinus]SEO29997.1 spore coat assembly protein SafA [Amphibacillus marinus]